MHADGMVCLLLLDVYDFVVIQYRQVDRFVGLLGQHGDEGGSLRAPAQAVDLGIRQLKELQTWGIDALLRILAD
jgi:hypothetical protein